MKLKSAHVLLKIGVLVLIFKSCLAEKDQPVVITQTNIIYGKLQTVDDSKVAVFLGIPYAQPPVGKLRFKKTVPLEPSTSVISATKHGSACLQIPDPTQPWSDNNLHGKNEDCLHLNIWAPFPLQRSVKQRLSVMFFIHGGGFYFGSNRMDVYDGRMLAAKGNVIVVVINYRLGPLGLFYTGSKDVPGNAALFDCLEALKWVYNNIANFGGDNTKITIFGESVGSYVVSSFASSEATRRFFKRVIMESFACNTPRCRDNEKVNYKRSLIIAKDLHCDKDNISINIDCLQRRSPHRILRSDHLHHDDLPTFGPQRDDEQKIKKPLKSVKEGDLKNVEVLVGVNKDEGSALLTVFNPQYFGPYGEKNSKINKSISEEAMKKSEIPKRISDFYLDKMDDNDNEDIAVQTYKAIGEYTMICPSLYLAEKMAGNNCSVYFYNFQHRPSKTQWADWLGTTHFEEIQFVFGLPLRKPWLYTNEEFDFSLKMIKIWTSFAKTGKPEYPYDDEKEWPQYTKTSTNYVILNLTDENSIRSDLSKENCEYQNKVRFK